VLDWGAPRLRDLPWRHTRDAWAVLVAEVMLQQTQALRVVPKWSAFIDRFPTPAACADASLGDVLREWHGLGYPRRARHLHDTASTVVEHHGGHVPDDLASLIALPGIGPYTARAVLAFAFARDVAVVDTNIARTLARTAGARLTPTQVQRLADALVPPADGWRWNQTLMDLGATTCRPTPHCADCPAKAWCEWHRSGHPHPDPAKGSAAVSTRQPRFEGSNRQARGRILRRLVEGAAPESAFDAEILEGLLTDGLIVRTSDTVHLPETERGRPGDPGPSR